MPTITQQTPTAVVPASRPARAPREMWASLAIAVIWLAVAVDALWGPDILNSTVGGTSSSVPSAVPLALFATFATWVVAKYGLARRDGD